MLKDVEGRNVKPGDIIVITRKHTFSMEDKFKAPIQTKARVKQISPNMISLESIINGNGTFDIPLRELDAQAFVRKFEHTKDDPFEKKYN